MDPATAAMIAGLIMSAASTFGASPAVLGYVRMFGAALPHLVVAGKDVAGYLATEVPAIWAMIHSGADSAPTEAQWNVLDAHVLSIMSRLEAQSTHA